MATKASTLSGLDSATLAALSKTPTVPSFSETRLYVRTIPVTATLDDLKLMFKTTPPKSFRVAHSNSLVGCMLEFFNPGEAERAFATMNNTYMKAHKGLMGLTYFDPNSGKIEQEPPCQTIMVKHVAPEADEVSIYNMFREIGHIYLCKLGMDENGTFRGFGLIQYWSPDDTNTAYERMNGAEYKGSTITLTQYVPRDKKTGKTPTSSLKVGSVGGSMRGRPGLSFDLFTPPSQSSTKDLGSQASEYAVADPTPLNGNSNGASLNQTDAFDVNDLKSAGLDPCNLYIKNLDPSIKSSDLFYEFHNFGHIISARVMMDEATFKSKGFGFVSFRNADDAARAMFEMDGRPIRSKPITVCIAEPKKIREARLAATFGSDSSTGRVSDSDAGGFVGNEVQLNPSLLASLSLATRNGILSTRLNSQLKKIQSIPEQDHAKIIDALLTLKIDDVVLLISYPKALEEKAVEVRIKLSNGSWSSNQQDLAESFGPDAEKQKVRQLVTSVQKDHVDEITDLLLGLSNFERAQVIFNPEYLSQKVSEAKSALNLTQASDASQNSSTDTKFPLSPENEKFVSELNGKPESERKQKLGSKLFPVVKSLGIPEPSKVTVRLLDSLATRELVYLLNEPAQLSTKISLLK
ncbi:RNA-binding domain-containing protein [Basidiobolus meristosporus CBS 931.73]|uniref:RNA-binding domain-containing protein n=1 Tax=Basidiobolus meristosporus CBS 931.73 TaxID=1314790 RepID=A0A1Y1YZJ3_9FUNG|nr:RNA-binding domain-containing protein [Basidiobolus meristosporus CBS 931.73]|eukprot:ORY03117.1 RNA-binding domain-containing protein [Basidiobolus meristosporus CBS 931.73]